MPVNVIPGRRPHQHVALQQVRCQVLPGKPTHARNQRSHGRPPCRREPVRSAAGGSRLSQARVVRELRGPIGLFPRRVDVVAAEVAVGRGPR